MPHFRGVCVAGLLAAVLLGQASGEVGQPSRSFVVPLENLELAKRLYEAGDPSVRSAVATVTFTADRFLTAEPVSVVHSAIMAPSNDPHDYMGYAAYWWPNPHTSTGLPWIRRDGFVNQDNLEDFSLLQDLSRYTEATSLAYYFTGDERYAAKTAELLRTWFLDESTRMNPRNEYSHMLPGASTGLYDVAGFGNRFPTIMDAAGIIESSASWTAADKRQLQDWTQDFLAWATTTSHGHLQFAEPSNHGTNYDFLHTLLALYGEDMEAADGFASYYFEQRMEGQIAADGSNPLEMKRANNLLYHVYNLGRAYDLASLTRQIPELDGFQYTLDDGRNLRSTLEYLIPYLVGDKAWEHFTSTVFPREPLTYYTLLRKLAVYYDDPSLLELTKRFPYDNVANINLTYPRAAVDPSSGDFDGDGLLTAADIDELARRIRAGDSEIAFDLNSSGSVDEVDFRYWQALANTRPGDANLDGIFNSRDFVSVFQQGGYEDALVGNSSWSSGDWNGDGEFTSQDFVQALMYGGYVADAAGVPEPVTAAPWLWMGIACWARRRAARSGSVLSRTGAAPL